MKYFKSIILFLFYTSLSCSIFLTIYIKNREREILLVKQSNGDYAAKYKISFGEKNFFSTYPRLKIINTSSNISLKQQGSLFRPDIQTHQFSIWKRIVPDRDQLIICVTGIENQTSQNLRGEIIFPLKSDSANIYLFYIISIIWLILYLKIKKSNVNKVKNKILF